MVLLHVLLIYHIKDVSGVNHKLSYNTRSDGKLCTLYLVKNKLSYETTFFYLQNTTQYMLYDETESWSEKFLMSQKLGKQLQSVIIIQYVKQYPIHSSYKKKKNLCLCAYGETLLARRIIVNNWDQLYFSQYFIRYTYIYIYIYIYIDLII